MYQKGNRRSYRIYAKRVRNAACFKILPSKKQAFTDKNALDFKFTHIGTICIK
jgi:hypothetical protein